MTFDKLRMSGSMRMGFDRLSLSGLGCQDLFTNSAQAEPVEARALTGDFGA